MQVSSVMQEHKAMTDADKDALKELQAEMTAKTGQAVSLGDAIKALSPGLETPAYLKNC